MYSIFSIEVCLYRKQNIAFPYLLQSMRRDPGSVYNNIINSMKYQDTFNVQSRSIYE